MNMYRIEISLKFKSRLEANKEVERIRRFVNYHAAKNGWIIRVLIAVSEVDAYLGEYVTARTGIRGRVIKVFKSYSFVKRLKLSYKREPHIHMIIQCNPGATVARKLQENISNRLGKKSCRVFKCNIGYVEYSIRQDPHPKIWDDDSFIFGDSWNDLSQVKNNNKIEASYTFDSTNMLAKAVTEKGTSEYKYDGQGRRINSKVTSSADNSIKSNVDYVVDQESAYGDIIMASDNESGKLSKYTYGSDIGDRISVDTNGIIGYYLNDELNSVSEILGADGKTQASISYDEFGIIKNPEAVNTDGNIFSYTGHVYDDNASIYYAKARYYDAKAGRFITEDTYTGEQDDPLSLNLYTYCQNEPIMSWNPDGHRPKLIIDSSSNPLKTLFNTIDDGVQWIGKKLKKYVPKKVQKVSKNVIGEIAGFTIKIDKAVSVGVVTKGYECITCEIYLNLTINTIRMAKS
jgi:RHS repeat-associated protein